MSAVQTEMSVASRDVELKRIGFLKSYAMDSVSYLAAKATPYTDRALTMYTNAKDSSMLKVRRRGRVSLTVRPTEIFFFKDEFALVWCRAKFARRQRLQG